MADLDLATQEMRQRIAFHEAGHAVIGYRKGLRFSRIQLEGDLSDPDKGAHRPGVAFDSYEQLVIAGSTLSPGEYHCANLDQLLAGRAAEKLFTGAVPPLPTVTDDGDLIPFPCDGSSRDWPLAVQAYREIFQEKYDQWKLPDLCIATVRVPFYKAFFGEYDRLCLLVCQPEYKTAIARLAEVIIVKIRLGGDEAVSIIERG